MNSGTPRTNPNKPRAGHCPAFLAALRHRAKLTTKSIGKTIGVSLWTVHTAENVPGPRVSLEHRLAIAHVCGATPEEIRRVRALDALDRGVLFLPEGVDEERVMAALIALGDAP